MRGKADNPSAFNLVSIKSGLGIKRCRSCERRWCEEIDCKGVNCLRCSVTLIRSELEVGCEVCTVVLKEDPWKLSILAVSRRIFPETTALKGSRKLSTRTSQDTVDGQRQPRLA
jgi:hypothetical protein